VNFQRDFGMILIQLKDKKTGITNLLIGESAKSPEMFEVREGGSLRVVPHRA
jgi:hypothetical protein